MPIQYALSYPERWDATVERVDWGNCAPITFGEADEETFGCLRLAKEAGRAGGTLPCAMNAANEVANLAFRQGSCRFTDIEKIVSQTMDATPVEKVENMQQILDVDARSRSLAEKFLQEV